MAHWPHAPCHLLNNAGAYIVTGATLHKQHFFKTSEQLKLFQTLLFELAIKYDWFLEAWAIFPNHYHFIAQSPKDPSTLRRFITHLHASTARELNKSEKVTGRSIWYQFWDTHLSYPASYYARLNYVMQNPVKHKLVDLAEEYPWCSTSWFLQNAKTSHRKVVLSFKTDKIEIHDDY